MNIKKELFAQICFNALENSIPDDNSVFSHSSFSEMTALLHNLWCEWDNQTAIQQMWFDTTTMYFKFYPLIITGYMGSQSLKAINFF